MPATTDRATAPAKKPAPAAAHDEGAIVMTRTFDAPRALVFKMWTEPEHVARWFGCAGSTIESFKRDLRVGGEYRIAWRKDDGSEQSLCGVYREIAPPERLVFTWVRPGAENDPDYETLVTVTFAERGGKTEMTLRHASFQSTETRNLHRDGWTTCFDNMGHYLKSAGA